MGGDQRGVHFNHLLFWSLMTTAMVLETFRFSRQSADVHLDFRAQLIVTGAVMSGPRLDILHDGH